MKKIAIATSNRADWGLLYPLVKELTDRGVKPIIIATYAHLLPEMGNTIQELVDDGFPPTMSVPARRPVKEAIGDMTAGFSKALQFLKPEVLVILGDRAEMLGVAAGALIERVPIAHIAGGTVSEGAFDDAIRNAISQMADYHFPETDKGRHRLILAGADPKRVVTAGALGVFNTQKVEQMPLKDIEQFLDFQLREKYVLGTFHPATLSDQQPLEQMKIWLEGLQATLSKIPDLKILLTFPNSDSDPTSLISLMYTFAKSNPGRVKVVPSLGRVRYINAARHAAAVAGNSSSGIVELPSVGVPIVDVGIRQKGRQRSKAVIHCDLDAKAIAEAIAEALSPEAHKRAREYPNPYFREGTPSIIADFLLQN